MVNNLRNIEATTNFASAHTSYEVCKYFIPLVEVNWFHVLDEGNGGRRFNSQAGGAVPAIANFEGGDMINLGSRNGAGDVVTGAIGFSGCQLPCSTFTRRRPRS